MKTTSQCLVLAIGIGLGVGFVLAAELSPMEKADGEALV